MQQPIPLRAYLLEMAGARDAAPTGDLLSEVLALTHADGQAVRAVDVVKAAQHVLLAFDQSAIMIGNIVHSLLREPVRWAHVAADPSQVADIQ